MPVAALLSGALLAGASLPACLGPVALVALCPLLRSLLAAPAAGVAFRDGLVAGLLFFGVGFVWVLGATVGGGAALPLTFLVVIPLLASGIGLFALALAWLARGSQALALAAAPGLWVAFEALRSEDWLFSIPWHHLGHALADAPALAQGASWFGVYGLSAWIVAVNGGLVLAPRLGWTGRLALAAALAVPLAPALGGAGEAAPSADGLRVAAVQPAIPERERHVPERLQANLGKLLEWSAPALAGGADLLAWPESAWERALGGSGDAFLATIAHHLATPLVTGAWRKPSVGRSSWRNAAVLATAEGRTRVVAEKVFPVPVYERAPEGPVTLALARAGLWSGRFGRGRPGEPLALAREGAAPAPIGVLVCIDASHPELARALRAAGARLLVAIANEAGTGAWSAALHARIARLRAIENRVPVVRVANTGPTLWIDARGRVAAALAPGVPASGTHALALAGAAPPYTRIGDAPVLAVTGLIALASVAARVRLDSRARRRGVDHDEHR